MSGENGIATIDAINPDALVAPEGTSADKFDMFKPKGDETQPSQSEIYGLPNLDPPKVEPAEPIDNTPAPDNKTPEPKPADATPAKPEDGSIPWYHRPFLDLKKRIEMTDEEFKLPEGLTADNYIDKYNEFLNENVEFEGTEQLNPSLRPLNDMVNKGMDVNEAIKAYNTMNNLTSLSDKELVGLYLKNEFGKNDKRTDGWDEAKINAQLTKMDSSGSLEIQAHQIRQNIQREKETLAANYERQQAEQYQKQSKEFEAKRNEQIDSSLKYLSGLKDVYGVPVSKADLQEFQNDFRTLVTPNEKGVTPLAEMLQSNENLVKVAFFLSKGDSKVKEALTRAKEVAKKNLIDKLDEKPNLVKKGGTSADPGAIDLDALSKPAR